MHVDAALPPVLARGVDGRKKRPCARCQRRLQELAPRVITVEPAHALTRRLLSPGATSYVAREATAASVANRCRKLLALQRPLRVPAEPTVLPHEPLGALRIAAKLPVEPAHGDRRRRAAVRLEIRAAVADGQ